MIKVRFKTWYWGNFCLADENEKLADGFEIYDEEKHGWKNSEEFKRGRPEPHESTISNYRDIVETSYIKRMIGQ